MITIEQLTTKQVEGSGVFDILMQSVQVRLDLEFTKGRITGPQYSEVYLGALTAVLAQSLQYVLTKEQTEAQIALINAQALQVAAQTDLTEVEIEKAQIEKEQLTQNLATGLLQQQQIVAQTNLLGAQQNEVTARIAQIEAETVGINQRTENAQVEKQLLQSQLITAGLEQTQISENTLNTIQERSNLVKQGLQVEAQTNLLGAQLNLANKQVLQTEAETAFTVQRTANAVSEKAQIDKLVLKTQNEVDLLAQKTKTEKAQILDVIDGLEVTGSIGAGVHVQKLQAAGFSRDAEQKAMKLFSDIWAIKKSTDPDATTVNGTGMEDINIQRVAWQLMRGIGVEPLNIPPGGGTGVSAGNSVGVLPGYDGSIESGGGSNIT